MATPYIISHFSNHQYCIEASEASGEESESKSLEEIDIDEYTIQNQRVSIRYPVTTITSHSIPTWKKNEVISIFLPPPEC